MLAYVALAIASCGLALQTRAHPSVESRGLPEVCAQIKDSISPASDVYPFGEENIGTWA